MSSRQKKFRIIYMQFREKVIEFEMERNLNKWEGNNKMFKKLLKSIKSKFKLKTSFHVYDPNDDMFVDDIDDLCGCYIGYENDYNFILSLHVKAPHEPHEPLEAEPSEKPKTPTPTPPPKTATDVTNSEKPTSNSLSLQLPQNDENTSQNVPTDSDMDDITELKLKPIEEIQAELGLSRRKSRRLSVDFSLFNLQTNCWLNMVWLELGAARIKSCDHINRLVHGLKYFMNLDIMNNDIDKDEFNHFFDDIYINMMDDYLHLIVIHNEDLEEIYKALYSKYHLNVCDITKCVYTQRHLSVKQKYDDDPWINLYIETYDSLHFWFCHMYEVGLRTMKKDKDVIGKKCKGNECYDVVFAKMMEIIDKRRQNTDGFTRYDDVTKYELKATLNKDIGGKSVNVQRSTFRDSLMFNLQKKIQSKTCLNKLNVFLYIEEYDTDAIVDDIDAIHDGFSNINDEIRNDAALMEIEVHIRNTNPSSSTFNIGLIFYYWPYYKKQYEKIQYETGYSASELYVEMKHATFKLEILNYDGIDIWEYNNLIVLKAKQYQQTNLAKSTNMKFNPHLHFDVESVVLTREHLIALILYSDFDTLSQDFASTFRQIRLNESLQSIKKRNQKYWWLSKSLREIVQYFGDNGSPSGQQVKGPFYTAMAQVTHVSEFNMRLCSPISTSTKVEVITRFNPNTGMIIQLNNNGDYENARYLRSFSLSWISKYKEDDERLFIGGDWKIRIEGIKLVATKQNFKKYFDALFIFDCICNGSDIDNYSAIEIKTPSSPPEATKSPKHRKSPRRSRSPKKETQAQTPVQLFPDQYAFPDAAHMNAYQDIICALIDYKLGREQGDNSGIPSYVVNTFNKFCIDKKVITLNLYYLDHNFSAFTDLIMNKIEADQHKNMPNPYSSMNTLKSRLFELFDNVRKLVIYSTKYNGFPSYSFSLMSLLSSVEFNATFKEIIIKATWHQPRDVNGRRSWIHTMWNTSPLTAVKSMLNESGCKGVLKKEKNNMGHYEDWLIIERE